MQEQLMQTVHLDSMVITAQRFLLLSTVTSTLILVNMILKITVLSLLTLTVLQEHVLCRVSMEVLFLKVLAQVRLLLRVLYIFSA